MMAELLLALLCGVVIGAILRRPRTRLVMESESETIARLRASLQADIDKVQEALLAPDCGWSEGDRLRAGMSLTRRLLSKLPEEPTHA